MAAIYGYFVLKPTGWLPWQIGGSSSVEDSFALTTLKSEPPMPYAKTPRSVMIYGLVTMGYHFSDQVYSAFFKERASDYWEM